MSTELLKSIEETEQQLEKLKEQLEESKNGNELWQPAHNQEYFSVASRGTPFKYTWADDSHDEEVYAYHNAFQSEAIADKAAELMRRSNLVISACLQVDPNFEPNWRNQNQIKWLPIYDHNARTWESTNAFTYQHAGACVSSLEAVQKVLEILNASGTR